MRVLVDPVRVIVFCRNFRIATSVCTGCAGHFRTGAAWPAFARSSGEPAQLRSSQVRSKPAPDAWAADACRGAWPRFASASPRPPDPASRPGAIIFYNHRQLGISPDASMRLLRHNLRGRGGIPAELAVRVGRQSWPAGLALGIRRTAADGASSGACAGAFDGASVQSRQTRSERIAVCVMQIRGERHGRWAGGSSGSTRAA